MQLPFLDYLPLLVFLSIVQLPSTSCPRPHFYDIATTQDTTALLPTCQRFSSLNLYVRLRYASLLLMAIFRLWLLPIPSDIAIKIHCPLGIDTSILTLIVIAKKSLKTILLFMNVNHKAIKLPLERRLHLAVCLLLTIKFLSQIIVQITRFFHLLLVL